MTNFYEFLRNIIQQAESRPLGAAPIVGDVHLVAIAPNDIYWLKQYLTAPEAEIHFKAKRVGGTDDDPIMAQDYAIAGAEVEIFSLLTEAMVQNPTFASLIQASAKFYQDHVPTCPDCQARVLEAAQRPPCWEFTEHKMPEQ